MSFLLQKGGLGALALKLGLTVIRTVSGALNGRSFDCLELTDVTFQV